MSGIQTTPRRKRKTLSGERTPAPTARRRANWVAGAARILARERKSQGQTEQCAVSLGTADNVVHPAETNANPTNGALDLLEIHDEIIRQNDTGKSSLRAEAPVFMPDAMRTEIVLDTLLDYPADSGRRSLSDMEAPTRFEAPTTAELQTQISLLMQQMLVLENSVNALQLQCTQLGTTTKAEEKFHEMASRLDDAVTVHHLEDLEVCLVKQLEAFKEEIQKSLTQAHHRIDKVEETLRDDLDMQISKLRASFESGQSSATTLDSTAIHTQILAISDMIGQKMSLIQAGLSRVEEVEKRVDSIEVATKTSRPHEGPAFDESKVQTLVRHCMNQLKGLTPVRRAERVKSLQENAKESGDPSNIEAARRLQ